MGNSLGGHNTGAKAVRSEKTRPVLGMKEGNRFGSSLASAAGAFASLFGVDGACSFSILFAIGAANQGSNVLLLGCLLGQTWAREGTEPARNHARQPTRHRRYLGARARPGAGGTATRASPLLRRPSGGGRIKAH